MQHSDDDAPPGFVAEFEALYRDPTLYGIEAKAYAWWCLVSAVQLASRHPATASSPVLKAACELAEAIGEHIATAPVLAQVMAQGWEQRLDVGDREDLTPGGLLIPRR